MNEKIAPTDHPVHDLISRRWSPRAFANRGVEREKLLSIFEAARWAPSSGNAQPWRFLVAAKDDMTSYERLLGCLKPRNQAWAEAAPVLVLACAKTYYRDDPSRPNRHALYELGLAVANLSLQATALGLVVHQMAGFLAEKVQEAYSLPSGVEPVTVLALGYLGNPETLQGDLQVKEAKPPSRKPLRELVYGSAWDEPAAFLERDRQAS